MTIIASTAAAAAIVWRPEWLAGDDHQPAFKLRAGTVLERELMESELAGEHLAGEVWPWELQEAIVTGFRALADEGADEVIALYLAQQNGEPLEERDRALLIEALAALAVHWPPYKVLLAQQRKRNHLIPLVAFRRFCVSWENVPTSYARGMDKLVTMDALAGIDPLVLKMAGLEAWRLQYPVGERKNSDAPSNAADDPATSSSGAMSTADGSSTESGTGKTPA